MMSISLVSVYLNSNSLWLTRKLLVHERVAVSVHFLSSLYSWMDRVISLQWTRILLVAVSGLYNILTSWFVHSQQCHNHLIFCVNCSYICTYKINDIVMHFFSFFFSYKCHTFHFTPTKPKEQGEMIKIAK